MSRRTGTFRWLPVLTVLVATLAMLGNDLVLARKAGGGARGGGAGMSRIGPAASGSVRTPRRATPARQSETRRDVRDQRRDLKRDVRDTRRDVKQDVRDTRRDVRDELRDVQRDHREWHEDRWKRRTGAALTRAAFRSLSCTSNIIIVSGVTYYRCGGTWYRRAQQSGDVVYIVVTQPAGYVN